MNKRYAVTVRETHTYIVMVDATDPDDARAKAEAETTRWDDPASAPEPDSIDSDMEDWDVSEVVDEAVGRNADRIDGYDRDDLGLSHD